MCSFEAMTQLVIYKVEDSRSYIDISLPRLLFSAYNVVRSPPFVSRLFPALPVLMFLSSPPIVENQRRYES